MVCRMSGARLLWRMMLVVEIFLISYLFLHSDNNVKLIWAHGRTFLTKHNPFPLLSASPCSVKTSKCRSPSGIHAVFLSQTQREKQYVAVRSACDGGPRGINSAHRRRVRISEVPYVMRYGIRQFKRPRRERHCTVGFSTCRSTTSAVPQAKRSSLCKMCWSIKRSGAWARMALASLLFVIQRTTEDRARRERGLRVRLHGGRSDGRWRRLAAGDSDHSELLEMQLTPTGSSSSFTASSGDVGPASSAAAPVEAVLSSSWPSEGSLHGGSSSDSISSDSPTNEGDTVLHISSSSSSSLGSLPSIPDLSLHISTSSSSIATISSASSDASTSHISESSNQGPQNVREEEESSSSFSLISLGSSGRGTMSPEDSSERCLSSGFHSAESDSADSHPNNLPVRNSLWSAGQNLPPVSLLRWQDEGWGNTVPRQRCHKVSALLPIVCAAACCATVCVFLTLLLILLRTHT